MTKLPHFSDDTSVTGMNTDVCKFCGHSARENDMLRARLQELEQQNALLQQMNSALVAHLHVKSSRSENGVPAAAVFGPVNGDRNDQQQGADESSAGDEEDGSTTVPQELPVRIILPSEYVSPSLPLSTPDTVPSVRTFRPSLQEVEYITHRAKLAQQWPPTISPVSKTELDFPEEYCNGSSPRVDGGLTASEAAPISPRGKLLAAGPTPRNTSQSDDTSQERFCTPLSSRSEWISPATHRQVAASDEYIAQATSSPAEVATLTMPPYPHSDGVVDPSDPASICAYLPTSETATTTQSSADFNPKSEVTVPLTICAPIELALDTMFSPGSENGISPQSHSFNSDAGRRPTLEVQANSPLTTCTAVSSEEELMARIVAEVKLETTNSTKKRLALQWENEKNPRQRQRLQASVLRLHNLSQSMDSPLVPTSLPPAGPLVAEPPTPKDDMSGPPIITAPPPPVHVTLAPIERDCSSSMESSSHESPISGGDKSWLSGVRGLLGKVLTPKNQMCLPGASEDTGFHYDPATGQYVIDGQEADPEEEERRRLVAAGPPKGINLEPGRQFSASKSGRYVDVFNAT